VEAVALVVRVAAAAAATIGDKYRGPRWWRAVRAAAAGTTVETKEQRRRWW